MGVAVVAASVVFIVYLVVRTCTAIRMYRNTKVRGCLTCRSDVVVIINGNTYMGKFRVSKTPFARGYMTRIKIPTVYVSNITSYCGLAYCVTIEWDAKLEFYYLGFRREIALPGHFYTYGTKGGQLAALIRQRDRANDLSISANVDKICSCSSSANSALAQ